MVFIMNIGSTQHVAPQSVCNGKSSVLTSNLKSGQQFRLYSNLKDSSFALNWHKNLK